MTLLLASHLSKYFGAEAVFVDLSCAVHPGEIIAFVGANGSGKSTLLEILAGRMEPDEGNVARARNTRLGYLPQTPDFRSDGTLWQAMEAVFAPLLRQARELRTLEELMASGHGIERDEAIERYGILLDAFERAGGFTYETQISRVLGGLGFDEEEFHTPVDHLSGGEKTRALLARLLLEEPDLLLLDEPTNHLDLEGIEWLEEQLKSWKGSMVIVAHDRAFLDALADRVWELQASSLESYRGNYTAYVQQREERRARKLAAYEAQQAHIAKTEDYIRRYMAGQRSAQAKGRLKRLEREERLKPPPEAPQNLHLDLETPLRSGDLVLGLYDLEVGYEEHHSLVTVDEVEIHRGERVALVGPNGSGKTSLLRTILRRVPPLRGRVRRGSAVRIGYFAQVQAHFDPERTVVETLLDAGMVSISETRSFLARYGFRGEEVFKKVGVLSGGERARVALAILALQRANFLLLDEPTNHLDLPSQEVLQEVLANFDGSILMVSHDRYLIRALATRVWALADGELHDFKGYPSYATWHEARREGGASEEKQAQEEQNHSRQDAERRQERARQRALARQQEQLEDLEATIHELEDRLQQLTVSLDLAGRAQDVDRVTRLGAEYRQVEMELNNLLEEWATIADAPVA